MALLENVFTIHKYEITVPKLPCEPILLVPFGDVHRYAPMCAEDRWLDFCDWARRKVKNKERIYFLGMGDYFDFLSMKERRALKCSELHESTRQTLDDMMEEHTDSFCKEISFMKGRMVGMLEGNHHGEFQSGITTTQKVCDFLDCKYLGVSSFIRIAFRYGNKTSTIDVWASHGRSCAKLLGSSLNQIESLLHTAVADVYLLAHDHKKAAGMRSILRLTDGHGRLHLKNHKVILGRTGSFLKGYEPDTPSYIAGRSLPPTDIGVIRIEFTPKREKHRELNEDTFYIDTHVSI